MSSHQPRGGPGSNQHQTKPRTAPAEPSPHTSGASAVATADPLADAGEGWADAGTYHDAGDVGGDAQAGPAHARISTFGPVDGNHLVVESYSYAAELSVDESDDRHGMFGVDGYTQYTMCTDPDDPGGSVVDELTVSDDDHAQLYPTVDGADAAAKRRTERDGPGLYEHWDPTDELAAGRFNR